MPWIDPTTPRRHSTPFAIRHSPSIRHSTQPAQQGLHILRAGALASAGGYQQAMHVVEQQLRTGPGEGGTLYNLARAVALSSAFSARDTSPPLPVREKTIDAGLAVLRDCVDFRRFLARLPAPARRSTR
jgi:hypothetical protein